MKIVSFKPERYRDCPVYFRSFKRVFEYLVIINNELYTAHISVIPSPVTRFFHWVGVEKSDYSEQLTGKILMQLRKMAHTTIDFIKDKK